MASRTGKGDDLGPTPIDEFRFPRFLEEGGTIKRLVLWGMLYSLTVLLAICTAVATNFKLTSLPWPGRVLVVVLGLNLSYVPPTYLLFEWYIFQNWLSSVQADNPLPDEQKTYEVECFKTNQDYIKSVWAVMLAVFSAFVISSK